MKKQGCKTKKWTKTLLRVFEGITVAAVLWLGTVAILASRDSGVLKINLHYEFSQITDRMKRGPPCLRAVFMKDSSSTRAGTPGIWKKSGHPPLQRRCSPTRRRTGCPC